MTAQRDQRTPGSRDAAGSTSARYKVRQPRLAEIVASELREEILCGDLPDGSPLPNQDRLSERFGVSKASLREAMRILESERLITVRRGRHGGVVAHAPTAEAATYTLGLMLHAQQTRTADLLASLAHLEPLCASLCAQREDRGVAVVPGLREAVQGLEKAVRAEAVEFSVAEAAFHERVVQGCGNTTLAATVGVLEELWRWQQRTHVDEALRQGVGPNKRLRAGALAAQQRMVELIDLGDAAGVEQAMRVHHQETYDIAHRRYVDHLIRVTVPNSEAMRVR
jgi:GntR family transcriptional repressor for pyruvate dehydrogenase complex